MHTSPLLVRNACWSVADQVLVPCCKYRTASSLFPAQHITLEVVIPFTFLGRLPNQLSCDRN